MKVLFIGVYKDGTGWGHMATNYILALDKAGVQVVPRVVRLSYGPTIEVHPRILELEDNDESGCDVVIQNILPSMMEYNGHFKNIGLYCSETSNFCNTDWAAHLNTMDELWVPNKKMVQAAIDSEVTTPRQVVHIPSDVSKYAQRYDRFTIPEIEGKFVFYTIGELNRRKNLSALIKAFHLEFTPDEPVALVIKCSLPGHSPEDASLHAQSIIATTKRELNLYPHVTDYINEVIITQQMTEEQMMQLHNTFDCFVSTSFGEAWCIPAFDAMGMGKTPICTNEGGICEFLDNSTGWLVEGHQTPCFGQIMDTIPGLYAGNSEWIDIDIYSLRYDMREAYQNKAHRDKKSINGIDRAYDFSYSNIGQKMRKLLECQT